MGALIAGVFQFPEDTFVPVQGFILGATWPSLVSQLLSGRQTKPTDKDLKLFKDEVKNSERGKPYKELKKK